MMEYAWPSSIEEAIGCLERHAGEARVIGGGTDVLLDLREGKLKARCLVDITRIPDLQRIEVEGDLVTIGAAVTFAAIRKHPFLREHVHVLVDAAGCVGALGIQNAATWVGNIVQAMPAADGAVAALALDAEAHIVSRASARWERVEAIYKGPGVSAVDPCREIVTALRFARPRDGTGTAWRRVGRRSALVLPIVNCAVRVEFDREHRTSRPEAGPIVDVAIALGPVAPRPFRAQGAESFLRGRSPRAEVLKEAGVIAREEANPRTSVMRASRAYRLAIIPSLVSEALATAVDRADGEGNGDRRPCLTGDR